MEMSGHCIDLLHVMSHSSFPLTGREKRIFLQYAANDKAESDGAVNTDL